MDKHTYPIGYFPQLCVWHSVPNFIAKYFAINLLYCTNFFSSQDKSNIVHVAIFRCLHPFPEFTGGYQNKY